MSAFTPSNHQLVTVQPAEPEAKLEMNNVFAHPEGHSAAKALVWELWLKSLTEPVDYCQVVVPATVLERLAFRTPQVQLAGQDNAPAQTEIVHESSSLEIPDISHVKLALYAPTSTSENTDAAPLDADMEVLNREHDSTRSSNSTPSSRGHSPYDQMQNTMIATTDTLLEHFKNMASVSTNSSQPVQQVSRSTSILDPTVTATKSPCQPKSSGSSKNAPVQMIPGLPNLQPRPNSEVYSQRSAITSNSNSILPQVRQLAPAPLASIRPSYQHLPTSDQPPTSTSVESTTREILHVEEGPHSISINPAIRTFPQIACRTEDSPGSEFTTASNTVLVKKPGRKRKGEDDGLSVAKKSKRQVDDSQKAKRIPKPKVEKVKKEPARLQLSQDIWMRILEFTPPAFLSKARRISKAFKGYVDDYNSISKNNRQENFGGNMPEAQALGLSERQYCNLLYGSKGCLEPGCSDKKAVRTHWSWIKRWCHDCWKKKIEREDKVFKTRNYTRVTLIKMLECLPMGMHDSFMKPHDIVSDITVRPRGAPRLYKYYLIEDLDQITADYDALTPKPYVPDPSHTPEEKAAAVSLYQSLTASLETRRTELFDERKAKNDKHMDLVRRIEAGIRWRREKHAVPNAANRDQRKELFTRRAREELYTLYPGMDEAFVRSTAAFKQATRISRDGGTERGWNALQPKIIKEWEEKDFVTAASEKVRASRDISRLGSVDNESLFGDFAPSHSNTPASFGDGQAGQSLDYFTQRASDAKAVTQLSQQNSDYSSNLGREPGTADFGAMCFGDTTNHFLDSKLNHEFHSTMTEAHHQRQASTTPTNLNHTATSVAAMFRDYQVRQKLHHSGTFGESSFDADIVKQHIRQSQGRYDLSRNTFHQTHGAVPFGHTQTQSTDNQDPHNSIYASQDTSGQYGAHPVRQRINASQPSLGYGNGLPPLSSHTFSHTKASSPSQSMLPPMGNFLSLPYDDFSSEKRHVASSHVQRTFAGEVHYPDLAASNHDLPTINLRQTQDEQMKANSEPRDDRLKISSLISTPSPRPYDFRDPRSQNHLQHHSHQPHNNYDYFSQGPL